MTSFPTYSQPADVTRVGTACTERRAKGTCLADGAPAARAVSAGVLAGLARVAFEDRFSVLSGFVEMGIQLAETEALRQSADAN